MNSLLHFPQADFFAFVSLVSIFLVNVFRCRAFEQSPYAYSAHTHTLGAAQSVNEHTRLWIFSSAKWISDFWIKTKGFYIHTNNVRFFFAFLFLIPWNSVCAHCCNTQWSTKIIKYGGVETFQPSNDVRFFSLHFSGIFFLCSFQHEMQCVWRIYGPICLHQMMMTNSTSNALIAVSLSVSVFYCSGHSSFHTWAGKKAKEHAIKDNSQFSNLHRLIVISDF